MKRITTTNFFTLNYLQNEILFVEIRFNFKNSEKMMSRLKSIILLVQNSVRL